MGNDPIAIQSLIPLLGTIAGVIGSIGAAAGVVYGFYRWAAPVTSRHVVAYRAAMGIGDRWGRDAGQTIRKLIQDVSRDTKEMSHKVEVLARHLNVGIYVCEVDGSFNYVNDALSEMFGLDSTAMLRHGWLTAIDGRRQAFETLKFSLDNKIPHEDAYVVINQRTRQRMCCSAKAYPIIVDGVLTCYMGYIEPVGGDSGKCPLARKIVDKCPMTNDGGCPIRGYGVRSGFAEAAFDAGDGGNVLDEFPSSKHGGCGSGIGGNIGSGNSSGIGSGVGRRLQMG